ncbi:hypothetical protein CcaverHIS641_0510470 [Cutaneotrichosporon cavernicola]|nr:hypothetical protein CcaverHIS641_0510470 [Cutaneotrichosporon cavernicola]
MNNDLLCLCRARHGFDAGTSGLRAKRPTQTPISVELSGSQNNYVVPAAFNSSVAIAAIIMFFGLASPGIELD